MIPALEPPSLDVDGVVLRLAEPADSAEVSRLSGLSINRRTHGLDLLSAENCAGLLAAVGAGMWTTPMMADTGPDKTIAFLALTNVDPRDLSATLLALLSDDAIPGGCAARAVARYIALVQWAYPLQRIECRVVHPGGGYRDVLIAAGLEAEGVVPGMAFRGGERCDVEFLSAIRETSSWSASAAAGTKSEGS